MPGRGSYGPGGKWIHDRAQRIMSEGDVMERYGDRGKSVAYALATQQAHKMGKTPKKKGGYGTTEGRRTAKAKLDKPRREYRKTAQVEYQEKLASLGGQDLRTPFMGKTQYPTDDSKTQAKSLLDQSQSRSEVGPAPHTTALSPSGPSIQQLAPGMPSPKGSLPKLGADMSYQDDPLIQYLKHKQAAVLDTNDESAPKADGECALTSDAPQHTRAKKTVREHNEYISRLFDHSSDARKKYTDKDR